MSNKLATKKAAYYSEEEKKIITSKYRAILKKAGPFLQGDDLNQIRKAFEISMDAHKEMRRKSGEPYIYHPLDVAMICVEEIGLGPTSIICALLHDVVEDTELTLDFIEHEFGIKVARIIDGLTKIAENFEQSQSAQAENFRKMLLTLSEDVRVILIKLADRLHNMRTLQSMARNSQLKIAHETIYIYAPLAHRLGLYQIKSELEDLYLKYNEPEAYREIAQKLKANKKKREEFIERFMEPIAKRLKEANIEFYIKGRPKHIYSIWNKIRKQNTSFENIYDLFAIRIILKDIPPEQNEREKAACWLAYSIVTDEYRPNPDRLKDWISTPRSNGYESLHTTVMSHAGVWVEVQIRTERMDDVAERGYAAHWKYKGSDTSLNKPLDIWLNQVRDTLETKDNSAMEFLEDFRGNLYNEEVFVFTPKGDLKVLRKGSTVLDFAYEIHTEIGSHCTAGKLNGHLVPISHVLSNGDQIEILTTKNQKPSEDWLRFVATTKAKARIKDALKEDNKTYVNDGKETITKRLKILGLDNNLETLNQLRAYFNKKDYNELFYYFGKGYLQPDEIKRFKLDREAHENKKKKVNLADEAYSNAKNFERAIKKSNGQDSLLIGDDMQELDYTLSKCCSPIPGDDVFGFLTVNEGIKVHRTNCPNSPQLLTAYGNRVIKATWTSQVEKAYLATIEFNGIDRMGIMRDVSMVISEELNINIRSVNVDTDEGVFKGYIKVFVYDTKHLEKLIRKLSRVEGVNQVLRIRNDDE
ncbi:bifunctional (p)ppGpp synthetase/guanosine-3',5'-bis(diphosphate) 3'-pyrophosphohydrolase [Marinilongibacter aquaticus]|uniref:RelA/SpoT family protein n=1 Tax=Marinilongibacter aquaticus TaxID=2975157 RepID=UPI0021BD503C|nr:bifunctional (p)ppGpp synthetase/guanosine-3',5'-bis(diphosphate) 3'-pyrophosphohydrolase [Marinilongibacter aquaticus]UBM57194.1 bifunctional (p)ppGpp synthetase/guanosine-3',5'-bis(diphosphate) 3'-pyrophosphohydrolase [Marinilongibacter aquaticus]